MILEAKLPDGSTVAVPGIVPKLSVTPGHVNREAPTLGQHTAEILDELGIDATKQSDWKSRGII